LNNSAVIDKENFKCIPVCVSRVKTESRCSSNLKETGQRLSPLKK